MEYNDLIANLKNLEAIAYGYNINGEVLGMDCSDFEQIMVDAVDGVKKLQDRAEKAERERDAAVSDLRGCAIESCAECMYCLYRTARSFCGDCTDGSNWQWKGAKEELR